MPTTPKTNPKKRSSLTMQIYAAMLGDAPQIETAVPLTSPRLKMRLKLEARLEHAGVSPFHRLTLREHVERCAAYAAKAIDDARERLASSKPKPPGAPREREQPATTKPVVLIGAIGRGMKKPPAPTASRAA